MKRITVEWLESIGVAPDQIKVFKRILGKRKFLYLTSKNIDQLYRFWLDVDEWITKLEPSDELRKAVAGSGVPECMIAYSYCVDKQPSDDIRDALLATGDTMRVLEYAIRVDRVVREDTLQAIVQSDDPFKAYIYLFRLFVINAEFL
jgi:hypothetical protein